MYSDILFTSLITSLFCAGLSLISREGNLLHFLRTPFENQSGWVEFISKPLIMCCTCMASVWGIIIYISLNGVPAIPHNWLLMAICCICSAFLNTLFINIIEKLES